jgi:hypothetical protein
MCVFNKLKDINKCNNTKMPLEFKIISIKLA